MSRQRGETFSDRELRILQQTAVEHALTAERGPTGLELAGALEQLRSDSHASRDEQSSVTATESGDSSTNKPTDGIGIAVPLTALAVVYASEFPEQHGGRDDTIPEVGQSPWQPDWIPTTTETDLSPAVVGAAVACCRFEASLARAAGAVDRSPETVARAARSLELE